MLLPGNLKGKKHRSLKNMFNELLEDLHNSIILEERLNDANQKFYTAEEIRAIQTFG